MHYKLHRMGNLIQLLPDSVLPDEFQEVMESVLKERETLPDMVLKDARTMTDDKAMGILVDWYADGLMELSGEVIRCQEEADPSRRSQYASLLSKLSETQRFLQATFPDHVRETGPMARTNGRKNANLSDGFSKLPVTYSVPMLALITRLLIEHEAFPKGIPKLEIIRHFSSHFSTERQANISWQSMKDSYNKPKRIHLDLMRTTLSDWMKILRKIE